MNTSRWSTETTGITPAHAAQRLPRQCSIRSPGSCTGSTYTYAVPLTGCPGSAPVFRGYASRLSLGRIPAVFVGTSAMLSDTKPDPSLIRYRQNPLPKMGRLRCSRGLLGNIQSGLPGWNKLPHERCVLAVARVCLLSGLSRRLAALRRSPTRVGGRASEVKPLGLRVATHQLNAVLHNSYKRHETSLLSANLRVRTFREIFLTEIQTIDEHRKLNWAIISVLAKPP